MGTARYAAAFKTILKVRFAEWRLQRQQEYEQAQKQQQEQFRLRREAEQTRRAALHTQLLAVFPTWQHKNRAHQRIVLHIGPTNSGKTHDALQRLAEAGSGWYLAPLRLLAFEIFDRLNARGVLCNLLTGEEYIPIEGAQITASTIEMFDPQQSGACVIIDEAHMLADPDRGWAWTHAIMEAQASEIYILGAPIIQHLVARIANVINLPLTVLQHERLTPIRVADKPWSLRDLPPRTILIGFSRQIVLGLKVELEKMGRTVSVIYGNLPPEVRRRQADRFAAGETEICVATDAVGMGLNLPADNVCFYELEKFDGKQVRSLTPNEVCQIGGRAGRYGLSQEGLIGAFTLQNLDKAGKLYSHASPDLSHARIAPSVEAIALIPGTLDQRLREWAMLKSIPDAMRTIFDTADMSERIELASLLDECEVIILGLATALRLINAPTRFETRPYWRACVMAILNASPMPLPRMPPQQIDDQDDLQMTENSILAADAYLWLSQRHEFGLFAPDAERVRVARMEWSLRVDNALLAKVDTTRRCEQCGRKLPFDHRYRICNECYSSRQFYSRYYFDDEYIDGFDDEFEPPLERKNSRKVPAERTPVPPMPAVTGANICPICQVESLETPQSRVTHWQDSHPDRPEVTISYAAWLIGCPKHELPARIPFSRQERDRNQSVRYWKVIALTKVVMANVTK